MVIVLLTRDQRTMILTSQPWSLPTMSQTMTIMRTRGTMTSIVHFTASVTTLRTRGIVLKNGKDRPLRREGSSSATMTVTVTRTTRMIALLAYVTAKVTTTVKVRKRKYSIQGNVLPVSLSVFVPSTYPLAMRSW